MTEPTQITSTLHPEQAQRAEAVAHASRALGSKASPFGGGGIKEHVTAGDVIVLADYILNGMDDGDHTPADPDPTDGIQIPADLADIADLIAAGDGLLIGVGIPIPGTQLPADLPRDADLGPRGATHAARPGCCGNDECGGRA